MTKSQTIGARFGLAILGAGTMFAAVPGLAQVGAGSNESPAVALSRNLNSLAANPRSLAPLMGAGQAALELGDGQAALTFFGRAEEIAPQDGRIKMWIGSALTHLQQPQGAQKFFAQAQSLGVPEADLAGERGLAFDIAGDPRSAQRDYRIALQAKRDPEITRRLALSLAISGEREPALRLLDEQLRVRDRDAERTRILVLALTGDANGAVAAVQASMPFGRGSAMAPFLQRLGLLNAGERAAAVHLGIFPQSGRTAGPVPNTYAAANPVQAGTPDPRQPGLGRTAPTRRDDRVQTASVMPPRAAAPTVGTAARPGQERPNWSFTARSLSQMPPPKTPGSVVTSGSPVPGDLAPAVRVAANAAPAPAVAAPMPSARMQSAPIPGSGALPAAQQFAQRKIANPLVAQPSASSPGLGQASAPQFQAPQPVVPGQRLASTLPQPATSSGTGGVAPAAQQFAQRTIANPLVAQPSASATGFGQAQAQQFQAPQPVVSSQRLASALPQPDTASAAGGVAPAAQQPIVNAAREPMPGPGFSILQPSVSAPVELASAMIPRTTPMSAPEPAPAEEEVSRTSRLADVAATIAALPDLPPPAVTASKPAAPVREPRIAPKPAAPKPEKVAVLVKPAAAKDDKAVGAKAPPAKGAAAKKTVEAPAKKAIAEAARVWVQVAGGANKATLPLEYSRLKAKAPKLLATRGAWTAPLKATNRLLVGPFKTEKEAQAFVNELAKSKLSGFAWMSEAGQKVEKLPAK